MRINIKSEILLAVAALLGLSLSSCMWMMVPMMATHDEQTKTMEKSGWTFWKKIEVADSPQEHLSIAKSYRQDAEDYRLLAEEHQRRKAAYQSYNDKPRIEKSTAEFMVIHCQRLVEKFTELADEMESLAQKHEVMAEKSAKHQREPLE